MLFLLPGGAGGRRSRQLGDLQTASSHGVTAGGLDAVADRSGPAGNNRPSRVGAAHRLRLRSLFRPRQRRSRIHLARSFWLFEPYFADVSDIGPDPEPGSRGNDFVSRFAPSLRSLPIELLLFRDMAAFKFLPLRLWPLNRFGVILNIAFIRAPRTERHETRGQHKPQATAAAMLACCCWGPSVTIICLTAIDPFHDLRTFLLGDGFWIDVHWSCRLDSERLGLSRWTAVTVGVRSFCCMYGRYRVAIRSQSFH